MTRNSSRLLAAALTGALVLGGVTAAQARGSKATKAKRVGTVTVRVTDSTDASICDSIWVSSVSLKGPNKSKKVRAMTLSKTSSVVDNVAATSGKDAVCTIAYSGKNFSAAKYKATFVITCSDSAAALCNAAALSVNGGTSSIATDTSLYNVASASAPTTVSFTKTVRITKSKSGKFRNGNLSVIQMPVAP